MDMELIEEKIQIIAKEMQEANASQWTITKIIKELNELEIKNETKLRKISLEKLKSLDPEAGQTYEAFSKMKVYTTKENIQNFNRGNIIKSLLKETSISRNIAEKITGEVENQIKDSKINFLTTALIREMVNAKLINYGFEEIRNDYARLGEPVYEIKQKINNEPYANEQTKEYNLLKIIPKKIVKKQFNGEIFIEDLAGFTSKIFSYAFVCEKKESLEKTIISNIGNLIKKRKFFYLTPNLFGLTFVTAPFLKKDFQTKKSAKLINELFKIPEEGFVNSLELFTPTRLQEYSEYKLKAVELSNLLLEQENSVVQIDSKYCLKLIEQKEKNFLILNNSNEEYFALNNKLFSTTQGIDLFVNINLEKLAEKNEDDFFSKIEDILEDIKKLKEIKQKELLSKKYLNEFNISEMKTGIGLTNIFTISNKFSENKTKEFANKIYKQFSKENEMLLFGIASKEAKQKFEKTLKKEIFSHEVMGFEECLNSKKCCFTGKVKTLKEANELIDKKVKQICFQGKN
ncbi:MAG: hypothetical protein PHP82_01435 [Candidatus ainarchaeum sp.]|nr:hypothetical protein [Candidatus ainarchaeum sp.]